MFSSKSPVAIIAWAKSPPGDPASLVEKSDKYPVGPPVQKTVKNAVEVHRFEVA